MLARGAGVAVGDEVGGAAGEILEGPPLLRELGDEERPPGSTKLGRGIMQEEEFTQLDQVAKKNDVI